MSSTITLIVTGILFLAWSTVSLYSWLGPKNYLNKLLWEDSFRNKKDFIMEWTSVTILMAFPIIQLSALGYLAAMFYINSMFLKDFDALDKVEIEPEDGII
jgi:hypothetical protein